MDGVPLILMIENAKREMNMVFGQVVNKSGLPAFLIEGIILDILSDIRNRKNIELTEALAGNTGDEAKKSENQEDKDKAKKE